MKINNINSNYQYSKPYDQQERTLAQPNFGKIKVIPSHFDSFERVLDERSMYKLEAIREDLTRFYVDCCSYYNMHCSLPTILEMLKSPKIFEMQVDYLHMYM